MEKDKNNRTIPCIDCITLSICKAKMHSKKHLFNTERADVRKIQRRIIVRQLTWKCSILQKYIDLTSSDFDFEYHFASSEKVAKFLLKDSEYD